MSEVKHSAEELFVMALVELDSDVRFNTVLKVDERLAKIEFVLTEDQVVHFVDGLKKSLEDLVSQGYFSLEVFMQEDAPGNLKLAVLGEKESDVFRYKRAEVDLSRR